MAKNYVLKRNGRREEIFLDKITSRIKKLCYGLNMDVIDPLSITLEVVKGLYPGVTTVELDNLAANIAASKTANHPDYDILAARIAVTNLHKETQKQFSEVIDKLYNSLDQKLKIIKPNISAECHAVIMKNANRLNSVILYDRDFLFDYSSFRFLERSYLKKINGKVAERPQHLFMRVSVGIHGEDIDAAIETYNMLSQKYCMHSGTTLVAAASPVPQLISNFMIMMPDDSIEGIYDCIKQCMFTTKTGGAIGLNIHNIRAKGSYIAGTNGVSNGIAPMLRVFNRTEWYVDQAHSKRQGDLTVYLEPWHNDIIDFLNLKKNTGKEELRAKHLFYALWVPDLFMERVELDSKWSLMCPRDSPGLSDAYGEEFKKLYEQYESEGNYNRQVEARKLWQEIIVAQIDTGSLAIVFKDACNKKSNQKHNGTIKGASFSSEMINFTTPKEIAACNTATISLDRCVTSDKKKFDFELLKKITILLVRNLNKIIDISFYRFQETKDFSLKHRPIAISVAGLADTLFLLRLPFDSLETVHLNKQVFETIYYGALEASCELAEKDGPYPGYQGSPISKGILQFDMWNIQPTNMWDWNTLRHRISKYGVRNSQLIALTPTNSCSRILGVNKSTEPYISNISIKETGSGIIQTVNHHLLAELTNKGLWNDSVKHEIIKNKGYIQNISEIPDDVRSVYKTAFDFSQKIIINLAKDRGAFIDQSQVMTLFVTKPNYPTLTSMHFYSWKMGLKTGFSKMFVNCSDINTSMNQPKIKEEEMDTKDVEDVNDAALVCSLLTPGACEMCSA